MTVHTFSNLWYEAFWDDSAVDIVALLQDVLKKLSCYKAFDKGKNVFSFFSTGYYGDGLNAIIVFAACFLPDSSRTDYNYVMENLFL